MSELNIGNWSTIAVDAILLCNALGARSEPEEKESDGKVPNWSMGALHVAAPLAQ